MEKTTLVNLHCHSIYSDGEQTPEALVSNLAAAGVRYAALTDHDSIEGLPRFLDASKKRGVACLPGVEMTTQFDGREAHLLGYGFDPQDPALTATLFSLRQVRDLDVHSIAGSLRKIGTNRLRDSEHSPAISAAPQGYLEIGQAIDLIHRAGGKTFWAHPLIYESDPGRLDACVASLKSKGLDGLEAIYPSISEDQQTFLHQLAQKNKLLVCAGTDFHANNTTGNHKYGIEMSRSDWIGFRQALFSSSQFTVEAAQLQEKGSANKGEPHATASKPHHFRRRAYVLRIFLPTLIAIGLFLAVIWGIILPSFEQTLLERKREIIHELTNSAWSILSSYERDVQNGFLSRDEAQALAIARIESVRYGPDGKDYFWIQDLQPRMIMHPYRSDLNGQDLEDFTDPRGVHIFVEFAELVRRDGEGYIDYVWQWKDDPQRLEPKQSFVKGFEPWGWLIGTGIYTDDVIAEIGRIERSLINTSLVISGAVVLLLIFVLQQSLRIEHERQDVLDSLHESTERYHSLIEATSEGTLLILEERCRYANPTFLDKTGYTSNQLEFLELADILPREAENQDLWGRLENINNKPLMEGKIHEGVLKHADGHLLECILAINPIVFAGQPGLILLSRDIARPSSLLTGEGISHAAQAVPVGIFRARAARRGTLVEMNPAAQSFFNQTQPTLADLFSDPAEFDVLLQTLQSGVDVNNYITHLESSDAVTRFLSLSARLVHKDDDQTTYIDGILEDVSTAHKQETGREALIEKLQASLLFLHEPIAQLGREVLMCDMHTSIEALSRLMTERTATAALVVGESNEILGIITDHDLRARVLAKDIPPATSIHTIMSAPLIKISEQALVYEALMRMEEKGIHHLVVEDQDGRIVSVIDKKSLVQFQNYGPIVLAGEISRSSTPAEIACISERIPPLVKTLLDSSARPRHATNLLASICDAATGRVVQLAIDELGPPPTVFAFIAMGSQGRQEQTLVTDQDNGIIFAPITDADLPAANEYFLRLGERVCQGLNLAGYPYCQGKVMASNPRWCRSLPDWISSFNEWVHKSEPQEIIDLSIFFDFRTVYGDTNLTLDLRRAIHTTLVNVPAFFHHLAQNTLMFKPPFRLLGNIYLSGGATEHIGDINLKDAMMPMVSYARLYALHHQINQTHTLDRIESMAERNLILPSSRDEIVASYDFLMQVRLQNQVAAIQAGQPPNNIIHPGKLGYIQQELLKQAFAQIAAIQQKVSYDFPGEI